jgi:uncharacterized protein YukJ
VLSRKLAQNVEVWPVRENKNKDLAYIAPAAQEDINDWMQRYILKAHTKEAINLLVANGSQTSPSGRSAIDRSTKRRDFIF